MATRTWTGTTSGDFNTAGNWLEGLVPVGTEDLIFDRGNRNLDTNVDQSAITVASVSFRTGYTGQAGNSISAPFKIGISGTLLIEGGGERLYLSGGTIAKTIMRGAGKDFGKEVYLAGTTTTVIFQRGLLYLESGTTTTFVLDPIRGNGAGTAADCYARTPTVTTLNQFGGNFIMTSTGTITLLENSGGLTRVEAGTLTTANLRSPASLVDWRTTTTLTTVNCYKGYFDASKQAAARTITNSTVYQGGTLDFYNGMDNLTRTNPTIKYGGQVLDVAGAVSFG